jgi:hypothetical protein
MDVLTMFSLKRRNHYASLGKREKYTLLGLLLHKRNWTTALKNRPSRGIGKSLGSLHLRIDMRKTTQKTAHLQSRLRRKIIGEILERTTGESLRNYKVRDWLAHWLDMKEQVRAARRWTVIAK